ncbi:MAG: phytanoyl-CoA dioxygenase [Spirochaetaceae bacterium]|nr:phytanoyl-CoA dioxygenase [Spirochaetaceae bacterium]|tara:strand:+ start:41855 stop:42634 length:780 start_codon:yes stop_codon:yes gene_type:complete
MELEMFSANEDNWSDYFEKNGFVPFHDLFPVEAVEEVRQSFHSSVEAVSRKYGFGAAESDKDRKAYQVFSADPVIRRNLYALCQEFYSIQRLSVRGKLMNVLQVQGMQVPVLRNQALRIDFSEEPQFLQGIHQDVRGMRSSNCLNFWIPLQDANEKNGTLAVYPGSHKSGGIKPSKTNSSGYQIFTDEDVAAYEKVLLNLPAGSCIMFHPYLFHGSVAADASELRLTVTLRYDDIADMDWLQTEAPTFSDLDIQKVKAL